MDAEEIARYPVVVKENPATYLVSDAEFALQCARAAHEPKRGRGDTTVRQNGDPLYALSQEAFISFVYEYLRSSSINLEICSLKDKWLRAAREYLSVSTLSKRMTVQCTAGGSNRDLPRRRRAVSLIFGIKQFRNRVVH